MAVLVEGHLDEEVHEAGYGRHPRDVAKQLLFLGSHLEEATTTGGISRSQESHRDSYFQTVPNLLGTPSYCQQRGEQRGMRLTAKERILLYLLEASPSWDAVEVSPDRTQEAIANGSWIELRHATQYLRPLVRAGLVQERQAHVKGIRQRRKVYDLTDAGKMAAVRLRQGVKAESVRFRDASGVHETTFAEAHARAGGQVRLLDMVRRYRDDGVVDLSALQATSTTSLVEILADAPRVEWFVGRDTELAQLTASGDGPRVIVIRGVAGIGKSALAAQACARLRGAYNLFWHRIRSWDTAQSVLASLGEFLGRLGRPGLRVVLARGEAARAPEVLREDLSGTRSFLVFDDAHEATRDLVSLFHFLKDALADAPDVRMLVLTRRKLAFYDRRDVGVGGVVREMDLSGLRQDEVAAFVAARPRERELLWLSRVLGGHPLFLRLALASKTSPSAELRGDARKFVEEAIYKELAEPERRMMKLACLFRVPVPQEALLSEPYSSYDVLLSLVDRALIMRGGEDTYQVHDTVREVFRTLLAESEANSLGSTAIGQLRQLAARANASGNFVSTINYLSNALELSRDSREKADFSEGLGDAKERIGDLPAALVAYKEGLRLSQASESAARFHRKMAIALQARGDTASAAREVDAAFESLGGRDDVERGWLNLVRSRISTATEKWSEGQEFAETSVRTFGLSRDVRGRAEALLELAGIQINSPHGNSDSAQRYLDEALSLSRSLADPVLIANVHHQFANLYVYLLRTPDRAMEHLNAIETLPGALLDVRSRLSWLMMKGWFSLDFRGDLEAARASFNDAMTLAKKAYDPVTGALAKFGAGVAKFHAGEYEAAKDQLEEAAAELLALGYPGFSVEALWVGVEICFVTGDVEDLLRLAATMMDAGHARGMAIRPVLAHTLKGSVCLLHGDRQGMHAAFEEAIRLAEQVHSPQESSLVAFAHDYYSVALFCAGEHRESARHGRLAIEYAQTFGMKGRLALRDKVWDKRRISASHLFGSSLT